MINNRKSPIQDDYIEKYLAEKELNLTATLDAKTAFMYPLLVQNGSEIRKALQKEKIYIPTLWPNVLKECPADSLEYHYAADILPIPIDQRYGKEDMRCLVDTIKRVSYEKS